MKPKPGKKRTLNNWSNFHTHSSFSDGSDDPEVYIKEAVQRNMTALGFSEHAPLPFPNHWSMSHDQLNPYLKRMESLKRKYSGYVQIYKGLEIDYLPHLISPRDEVYANLGLDYRIGSVHLMGQLEDGNFWSIDSSKPGKFEQGFEELYQNDVKNLVRDYYGRICEMVSGPSPDLIGHLDLIKMNTCGKYLTESERWYQELVLETLEVIAQTDVIVEVNTGGIIRNRFPATYPSAWILKQCFQAGIPVTLSSDAHRPQQITGWFEETAGILRKIGYSEIYVLKTGDWQAFEL